MKQTVWKFCALLSLVLIVCGTASAAPIMVDAYTDEFPVEEFIVGYAGTTITQVATYSGLEVGNLYFQVHPTNDEPGESLPAMTQRLVETITQTGLAGVLGGQRTGTLTSTGTVGRKSDVYIGDEYSPGNGDLWWNNGALAKSNLLLEYGNVTPLNANFSSLGTAGYFLLDDWSMDVGNVTATLSVTSGSTTQSSSVTLYNDPYETPADYTIPFSGFNLIDFSDVDVIRLQLVGNSTSQDSGFMGALQAVPEPGTLLLLGLGALAAFRRKRTA